jgi:short-subunit dehydrogenase
MSLAGKTILVTGSTDGLGYKLVHELASLQANIIVHGRSKEKVNALIKELKQIAPQGEFSSIVCDLSDLASIEKSFGAITSLDILINNAGVWLEGSTTEATSEKIIELLHVNLGAPLLIARTLLPVLAKSSFAQILNVVSVAGVEIPSGYFHTIYSATKFGLQAFSEALEKEYDNKKLRVMGYYPGGMETKLFKKAGNDYKDHEPWMFDPQESVEAIVFMLTRDEKLNVKRMDLINHLQK